MLRWRKALASRTEQEASRYCLPSDGGGRCLSWRPLLSLFSPNFWTNFGPFSAVALLIALCDVTESSPLFKYLKCISKADALVLLWLPRQRIDRHDEQQQRGSRQHIPSQVAIFLCNMGKALCS
jgi:hypothetical protein